MAKASIQQVKEIVKQYLDSNKIAVSSFNETRDNIVGLLDKIGKIIQIDNPFLDKLIELDGEDLPLGKTVEEYYQDLILPIDYDGNSDKTMARFNGTYRKPSYSYSLGRKVIPESIPNNNVERAVNNVDELNSIVSTEIKRLYDSEALYKYSVKKGMLGLLVDKCYSAMNSGVVFAASTQYDVNTYLQSAATNYKSGVVVKKIEATNQDTWDTLVKNGFIIELDLVSKLTTPIDTNSSNAFIKEVKKYVEKASFINEGNSLNGNTIGIQEQGLLCYVNQGVLPNIDVDSMAGAFHMDKLTIPAKTKPLDGFGNTTHKVLGILIDARGARLHRDYFAIRENLNGLNDYLNMFMHMEYTVFLSLNTFVHVFISSEA